ncbi:MAG: hypothetical protein N2040_00505 [Caldimonas manganoxidans]|nr:hypothetical protein [Caldimonas manganoxidans]
MSEHPLPSTQRSTPDPHEGHDTLDAALRSVLDVDPPGFDPEAHFRGIERRLKQAHAQGRPQRWARLRQAWQRAWMPASSFGLGAAVAALLMLVWAPQWLEPPTVVEPLGQAASSEPGSPTQWHVRFRDDATLSAMRAALQAVDGEVIGGPGALGLWRIRMTDPTPSKLDRLASDPIVLDVQPAP